MNFNLIDTLSNSYRKNLNNKMTWANSKVNQVYEDVMKYITDETLKGSREVNISFDKIKEFLGEDISKDDGYFIVQSFISTLENGSYFKVSNKKRLSFDIGGWDVPWVKGTKLPLIDKTLYDNYKDFIMNSDNSFEKCRILFLEYLYDKIKDCCSNAKEIYTDNLNFREIFKDRYSAYIGMSGMEVGNLFNEVRKDLEESGIDVSMLTYDLVILGGWNKKE